MDVTKLEFNTLLGSRNPGLLIRNSLEPVAQPIIPSPSTVAGIILEVLKRKPELYNLGTLSSKFHGQLSVVTAGPLFDLPPHIGQMAILVRT